MIARGTTDPELFLVEISATESDANLATRWRHLIWLQSWSPVTPGDETCISYNFG